MSQPQLHGCLAPGAKRAIERDLLEAVAIAVVEFLYGPLAEDPYRMSKPLRLGLKGYRSARRGHYRVICSVVDDQVLVPVMRLSHRSDVYG
jgi:mRNA-degrading endonuclease RelE of RelBE toxin-antitoxin system